MARSRKPDLWLSEVGARQLAPFFLSVNGDKFHFSPSEERKWIEFPVAPHVSGFVQEVRESVKHHGVLNPINVDQVMLDGEIRLVCRHGATRVWAARLYNLPIPVMIDIKDGDPPEDAIPVAVEDAHLHYNGRHILRTDRGATRMIARDISRFQR